jgi:hypothetical protein
MPVSSSEDLEQQVKSLETLIGVAGSLGQDWMCQDGL